ncbi:MAG: cytochrome c biogenesis protein CcsA [Chthonomonas sp.]|nr:cytochrome c biogenesis protein CcsA [Chthonomonas sp.]
MQPQRIWPKVIALLALTAITVTAPPAKGFMNPDLARILFWHLPCALLSTIFLFMGAFWAFKTISKPTPANDARLAASLDLAAVLAILTLLTGMVFSKVQWGAWWSWDPRQTSYLFVTLILLGGMALRSGLDDDIKKAKASAGYALVMLVPIAFLTFVYPRLPQVQSLHPSDTIQQGSLDSPYRMGVLFGMFAIGFVCIAIWKVRVLARALELQLADGAMAMASGSGAGDSDRGGRPGGPVVDDETAS